MDSVNFEGRHPVALSCNYVHSQHDVLYCSPNIVRVIKSRRMRWAGHVARMGEERGVYRVLVGETGGKETTGET